MLMSFVAAGLDVDPNAEMIKNVVITNVGGSGYFDAVVDMIAAGDGSCSSSEDACVKKVTGLSEFEAAKEKHARISA